MKIAFRYLLLSILVLLCFINGLMAQSKEDYAYQVIIEPNGDSSLQKFNLTNDIYRYSKSPHLSDLKVFDAMGQTMPFEINPIVTKVESLVEREINYYPLFEKQNLLNQTENIVLSYNQKNQLDHLEKTKIEVNTEGQLTVGYILDLGEKPQVGSSEFEFLLSKVSETSFLHFNVDQSDDLKNWSRLSNNDVLAQLLHQQDISLHNKILLKGIKFRYLRLSITDQSIAFEITGVKHTVHYSQSSETILWQDILFINQAGEAFLTAELPSTIPAEYLKFELNEKSSFLTGHLYYKNLHQAKTKRSKYKEKQEWLNCCAVNLYQVRDADNILSKNQMVLNGFRSQALKLTLAHPTIENNQLVLKAQIGWQAQALVFLAAGQAPYYIVSGEKNYSVNSAMTNNQHNPIITNIKKQIQTDIPVVSVISTAVNQQTIDSSFAGYSWPQITLWSLMFAGVGFMLWMARNLLKKLSKEG